MDSFYLIYNGYDDPCPMTGPYPTYDAALAAYRATLIESGADIDTSDRTEDLYLTDDAVRVGVLRLDTKE